MKVSVTLEEKHAADLAWPDDVPLPERGDSVVLTYAGGVVEFVVDDRLFSIENPALAPPDSDWREFMNPDSLRVLTSAKVEPSLAAAAPGARYQFERIGYFCVDPDSASGRLVFNRTVSLKDTWAKIERKG